MRSLQKKFNYYRPAFAVFQRYAHCPKCYTEHLTIRNSFDKIDEVSRNPLRSLLLGCTIYHCTWCRYQFRDWRSLDPSRKSNTSSG